MNATQQDLKTFKAWLREGRAIIKGSTAGFYLVDDERVHARALFDRAQTEPFGQVDVAETEGWTIIITAEDWEQLKAERKDASRGPRVKLRRPADGGTEVWCGPDVDLINLLKSTGFTYQPAARYWFHPNKDAETTARAFENGKVRGRAVRVVRDWTDDDVPVL